MVRTADPNDRIVSMMVNWKMVFKEVAKTSARATKNVCHRTTLSQNQKCCLHTASTRWIDNFDYGTRWIDNFDYGTNQEQTAP